MGIFRKHPGGEKPIVGKATNYDYSKVFGHEYVPPFERNVEIKCPEENKDARTKTKE